MNRPNDFSSSIVINGKSASSISVFDRGLQYGDGVFETIAVVNGTPLLYQQHLSRLFAGAEQLKIPFAEKKQLEQELIFFTKGLARAVVKVVLTRGQGGRGYGLPEMILPTRILTKHEWPDYPAELIDVGAKVRICDLRLAKQSVLAGLKHLNRLEQIMARSEWDDDSIFEGLMMDVDDNVIEGTMSNLFLIVNDKLITPDLNDCGVKGVLREHVMGIADRFELIPEVRTVNLKDLQQANEIFLTNSIIGICPVSKLANFNLPEQQITKKIRKYLLEQNVIATI